MERYNGWANRDTWLVGLWINNDERNYRWARGNKSELIKLPKDKLIRVLKRNLRIGDSVNWNNVRITEIKRDVLREL